MASVAVAITTATTTAVLPTAAGYKYSVYAYDLTLADTAKFQSASTDLTGTMGVAATNIQLRNAGFAGEGFRLPLFETAPGEALNIVSGGNVKGYITYEKVSVN